MDDIHLMHVADSLDDLSDIVAGLLLGKSFLRLPDAS